jgi:hypothetical protein
VLQSNGIFRNFLYLYPSSCKPRQFPPEQLEKTEEYVGRGWIRESQDFLSDESIQFGRK